MNNFHFYISNIGVILHELRRNCNRFKKFHQFTIILGGYLFQKATLFCLKIKEKWTKISVLWSILW